MKYYDEDERILVKSVENGEWYSVQDLSAEIAEAKKIARATRAKDARINIRLSSSALSSGGIRALD